MVERQAPVVRRLVENLVLAMRERGWDQVDLARAAGIGDATISRLLSGRQEDIRLGTVERLARALGLPLAALLGPEPGAGPPADAEAAALLLGSARRRLAAADIRRALRAAEHILAELERGALLPADTAGAGEAARRPPPNGLARGGAGGAWWRPPGRSTLGTHHAARRARTAARHPGACWLPGGRGWWRSCWPRRRVWGWRCGRWPCRPAWRGCTCAVAGGR
jgi:transcriptional regulator with XRE-family HTH domain